jgi:sn-glycerol 3-phosphate transport system ATP-binding protein
MADIAIRRVTKSYAKTPVIHGVDLDIRNGEFVVILGPSGCGKSTLLRMIAGLEEITGGEIAIAGRRVNELEPRERGCAMVFQNYALYPHMSVADNMGYALKVAGMKKAERMAKVREVARIIGLEDFLDRKPGQLSGGQRQRVAMGRAIVREPKVFLFDEPLSNLDAKLRVQMRVEIRRLHKRLKATSIFVTHDQVEAMTMADRLVIMNKGHVEQVGTPNEVYDAPASRFVGEFIGSPPMSFLEGEVGEHGRVRVEGGRTLPFDATAFDAAPGQGVHVGIRAEHLRLDPYLDDTAPVATVDFFEELGSGRLLHVDLAGRPLVAHVGKTVDFAPGTQLSLTADPAHVHLFDAESGARLPAPTGVATLQAAE